MTAQATVIEKLKKILALADRAGTDEEAATAANMAAALALKYNIDLASVQGAATPRAGFKRCVLWEEKGGYDVWIMNLVGGVVALHGGKPYYQGWRGAHTQYCAVVRSDLEPMLKSITEYLVKTILRMNTEAVKGRSLTQPERAQFRKAFRLGASAKVRQRLLQQLQELTKDDAAAQAATGSTALVVLNHVEAEKREVEEFMKSEGFDLRPGRATGPRSLDASGYAAGTAAGGRIGLNTQIRGSRTVDNARLK